jgi:hypothetical protein
VLREYRGVKLGIGREQVKAEMGGLAQEGKDWGEFKLGSSNLMTVRYDDNEAVKTIRYQSDAWINGLEFDRHAEETAVDTFARGIKIAGEQFFEYPLGAPLILNWNCVASAFTHFFCGA